MAELELRSRKVPRDDGQEYDEKVEEVSVKMTSTPNQREDDSVADISFGPSGVDSTLDRKLSEDEETKRKLKLKARRKRLEMEELQKQRLVYTDTCSVEERMMKMRLEEKKMELEARRLEQETDVRRQRFKLEEERHKVELRAMEAEIKAKEERHKAELRRMAHKDELELKDLESKQIDMEERRKIVEKEKDAYISLKQEEIQVLKDTQDWNIPMSPFSENDSIERYLEHFEIIAQERGWKQETWGRKICGLLQGKARDAYMKLSVSQREDWRKVKETLLTKYLRGPDYYRKKFRETNKEREISYQDYLEQLEDYAKKWMELSGRDPTRVEDVWDLFILEQFMIKLSRENESYVRLQKPKTAREAAQIMQEYIDSKMFSYHRTGPVAGSSDSASAPRKITNGEGKEEKDTGGESLEANSGHKSKDVEEKRKCYRCQKSGHIAKHCPKSNIAMVCNNARRLPLTAPSVLCGECADKPYSPLVEALVNGVRQEILRDTGADVCVVHENVISETDLTGKGMEVRMADGTVRQADLAIVSVDSPFLSGRILAVVLPDPSFPLILGNSATFVDGKEVEVPVYARAELVAAVTRSQARKEADSGLAHSRRDRIVHISGVECNPEEFRHKQKSDTTLTDIWEQARTGQLTKAKSGGTISFEVKNGILKRKFQKNDEKHLQTCVPKELREEVMRIAHDTPMGGHLGIARTRSKIWQEFYWPGMCSDISTYCRTCEACQKTADRGRVSKFPLGTIPLVDQPFKRVAVDLIGPLEPPSDKGKRFILVMVDYATKYPEAVALRNITAESVCEALFDMWTRLGIPEQVLTDRGSQFTGELMNEAFALLRIKGLKTTPYHAQCNGLVERFNGTIKKMIRRLTREKPRTWDRFINAALFAYREVPQETTGFSPFELLYGRKVRGPMAVLKSLWTDENMDGETKLASTYVCELRNRIAETCALARQNASVAALKQKEWFDKKAAKRDIQVKDKVLVLLPTKKNKLQLEWQGPFQVEEKLGDCDFRVAMHGGSRLYHGNLLKRYHERLPTPTVAAIAVVTEELDEQQVPSVQQENIPLMCLKQTQGPEHVKLDNTAPERHQDIQMLVKEFPQVLSDVPGHCSLTECNIQMKDSVPVNLKQYPLPHSQREVVSEEVKTMLDMGVIEHSQSPFSSPIVLVKKTDGQVRFCIDFRALNKKIVFDGEPIPDVEHLFTVVQQCPYLSKLDLTKGYWQIPMSAEDKEKTAFSTPDGHFQWRVMPFGMSTSGAVFSRMMRQLILPLKMPEICNFIDDILVATSTWERHLECLRALFERLAAVGLTVKPSKCMLGFRKLPYLGFVLGESAIAPEQEKITKIQEAARPCTKKQLRSFLGLAGFYRRFVPHYATIALPLTDATKQGEPTRVKWDEEKDRAFKELKGKLTSPPICILPKEDETFILRTDASDAGLGAVLMQDLGQGPQPISYASKKLNPAERRYSTIEKECLAVVWGVKKFAAYLFGRQFIVQTDHSPLHYLQRISPVNGRLMRWSMLLQDFSFRVEVIPGKDNVQADYMSRLEAVVPEAESSCGEK